MQVTRFLENQRTAVHGKVARHEQFTNVDTEFEAGVDHAFAPHLVSYAYGHISPGADFRPQERIAGGGAVRLLHAQDGLPVWATLDARYDRYAALSVLNANPGLRIEPVDGWSVAARLITVDQENAKRLYGTDYRLDGTLSESARFFVGYADAPETQAAVTVDTKTYFGGVAMDITPQTVLRLSYAQDDRENSYIRRVVNASVGYRF